MFSQVKQITSPRQSPTKSRPTLVHARSSSSPSTHLLQSSFPWLSDDNMTDDHHTVKGNNGRSGDGIVGGDVGDDDYRRTVLVRQLLDTTNVADQMAIIHELSHLATTTTTTGTSHTNPTTISAPITTVSRSDKMIDSPGAGPRPSHSPSHLTSTNLHHHRPHAASAASPYSSPSSHPRPTSSSSSSPSGADITP